MVNSLQMDAVLYHGSLLPEITWYNLVLWFLCFYYTPEQKKVPFSY